MMEANIKKQMQIIFVVDDLETNLVAGKNALADTYNVYTFDSGMRMLKVLEKLTPDLILLDIKMPEMSGYDVIKTLKDNERTANIPVIFLSALTDEEDEDKGLSLGAVDYISKPFDPPILQKRVEVHLASKKANVE